MAYKLSVERSVDSFVSALADEHDHNSEAVLEILQALRQNRGELVKEDVAQVAQSLNVPEHQAFGVATFYTMLSSPLKTIRVCDGPACWLKGAAYVQAALDAEFNATNNKKNDWIVERNSCLGLCDRAPAALVMEDQCGPLDLQNIVDVQKGWRGEMPAYTQPRPGETRVLLKEAGQVDPDSSESALKNGAYRGLAKALSGSREEVIASVEASGLRGRGGAGFPAGRKLRFVAQTPGSGKYVICNADESEPLVFKDRVLIDTNPHKILEGMAIAALAVGARDGFIYIRGEYSAQAARLERAINQAEERNWLGDNIQGSDFSFHIHIHKGAGAYICGEETALIESLEGKRGEPRIRPPFPASYGYRGAPTLVNNVETFAYMPAIILYGADWYCSIGSPNTPGTKLYTVLGHVNQPGIFEAPYGLTLHQIIEDFAGGMLPGSEFSFALTGGAAGTIVPPRLMDAPIDYDSASLGVSLGAGAFLICDQSVSPKVLLRELMHFFETESCGKCTPCRVGTRKVRMMLDRMMVGKAGEQDIHTLQEMADLLQNASFCGLGQSAAIPIKSAIKSFPEVFKE